ncbi:hypothetical protein F5X68DRAFT_241805 [Plectosphaerella plurivora]|uniref:Uncharacterized protein n=1 Tax=Plectosphaerella plurivora TaxID=936078 RepID=A0A9P8V6P6_9PEZI|nr:hypothetical protein F5X68DRAFT_241805 [Plectosphaerella plurivora]
MADEYSDQKSRRERGVLAQREYRRRHASKFQALQAENDRLKRAIADIDTEFHSAGSRNRLKAAILRARKVAGLPPQESDASVSSIPGTPVARPDPGTASPTERPSQEDLFLENLNLTFGTDLPGDSTNVIIREPLHEDASSTSEYPAGNTFAGCIFWRALAHSIPVFDYTNGPDRETIHRTAAEIDLLMSRWVRSDRPDVIDRLWQRRLRFRTKGDRLGQLAGRYGLSAPTNEELSRRARQEYTDLKDRKFWRTSAQVEAILIATLTAEEWARFVKVLDGKGENRDVELLLELVESMAQTYFCIGEGPRWNCIWTHMAIGAWVKKLRTSGNDTKMIS